MPITAYVRIAACSFAMFASTLTLPAQNTSLTTLAAQYRADATFPDFDPMWRKTAPATGTAVKPIETGGGVFVYLQNTGKQAVTIDDVLLAGVSLTQAVSETDARKFKKHFRANSIHFSKLSETDRQKLVNAGEPVWWRVEPKQVPAGGVAEVYVRLRRSPLGSVLDLQVKLAAGARQAVVVPSAPVKSCVADVCFSPSLDTAYLYFAGHTSGTVPKIILVDGVEVTAACKIGTDARLSLVPVVFRPARPFERGSDHCFQAIFPDGTVAIARARVFPADFVYGLWGARRGEGDNAAIGRAFVDEIVMHNINLQMPGVGSPAVASFYKSEEGHALLEKVGVRRVLNTRGKAGYDHPYAYYLADEPDAADSRVPGVPNGKQIGCLGQGLVEFGDELHRGDPLTPSMLNVDSTYAPFNWPTYGQLPDIFAADPYYQPRQREAWAKSPERVKLFSKATYVYAVASICKAGSGPRPLHIMLYGNRYEKGDDKFRGPTPPEKRIEAYYAVAAGAKGLSYWWFTSSKPAVGLGAAEPGARALWREVGLVGAELRTAGPLITRSSPVALPIQTSSKLWVKALAVGLDTLVLVVVNDDYLNDREGTKITPVAEASVRLTLPSWLEPRDTFEIATSGTKLVTHRTAAGQLTLDIGKVDVTRLLVVTSDSNLRHSVQDDYAAHYAGNVAKLLGH